MAAPMDRRRFIKGIGRAGAAGYLATTLPIRLMAIEPPEESGTLSGNVVIPQGFTVPPGATLRFDPNVTTTVRVKANVVVRGTLEMKPVNSGIRHALVFEDVDESRFVGGGVDVLESDVGLWVIGEGRLDLRGSPKTAWNRTGWDSSWSVEDEVRVTPTARGDRGSDGFRVFRRNDSVPSVPNPLGYAGGGALSFGDTIESIHRFDIEAIAHAGITKGCNPPANDRFCPEEPVTRGQMAAFLVRATPERFPAAGSAGFVDIRGHTFESEINRLAAAGVTKGCNPPANDRFCPEEPVTRGQMAAFLVRAMPERFPAAGSARFVDSRGHTFESEIDRLAAAGVTKGCNPPANDRFCPEEPVTRAQMASFLNRALDLETPPIDTDFHAEVLNLTRNVVIRGEAGGRAHVFIRSGSPQRLEFVEMRHLGPRTSGSKVTEPVAGRYALHFHHCHEGSKGSVVRGVVTAQCGNHAFVAHLSHGVSFADCVTYDTFESAYWWDEGDLTNDVSFTRCVAALVRSDPAFRGFRLAGFTLGRGDRMSVRDCVAVGVQGTTEAAGFSWPEFSNSAPNIWIFENNVAHNNTTHGIFVWQNTATAPHDVDRFTAYRCGGFGVRHGAYRTPGYHYDTLHLFENDGGGIQQLALHGEADGGRPDGYGLSFERVRVVGGEYGVKTEEHQLISRRPTLYKNCFFDVTASKVKLDDRVEAGTYDFVNCDIRPDEVDAGSALADTRVRVQNVSGESYRVTPVGVEPIVDFYSS